MTLTRDSAPEGRETVRACSSKPDALSRDRPWEVAMRALTGPAGPGRVAALAHADCQTLESVRPH